MKKWIILIVISIISILISLEIIIDFSSYIGVIGLALSIGTIILSFYWRYEDNQRENWDIDERRLHTLNIIETIEDSEKNLESKIDKNEIMESKVNQLMEKISQELHNEHINKEFLLRRLDRPIFCLLVHKTEEDNIKDHKLKSIRDSILPKLGFRGLKLSRGIYILPPSKMPPLRNKEELDQWINKKILKRIPRNHRYIFSFIALIDLRYVISIKEDKLTKKNYETLLEVINPEELITISQGLKYLQTKKNISFKDLINLPSLSFLSDNTSLDLKNRELLKQNNDIIIEDIERDLKKEIFTENIVRMDEEFLQNKIKKYLEINMEDIKIIKFNARFWMEILKNKKV
ncbi:MAG: hypothetical protein PHF67_04290 [Candidatus Nanoarchaeia archaeon]|nr:hypothetical protein [Candidatus Nanoarchaeia archaeon]